MKKLPLPLFLLLFVSVVSAQKVITVEKVSPHSVHIIGDNFEGVVFDKDYSSSWLSSKGSDEVIYAPDDQDIDKIDIGKSDRFTPSTDDIILTEDILQSDLKLINKKLPSSNNWRGPVVYRSLQKYLRQYFGFINKKMEKVIYINCFWNDDETKEDTYWLKNYYHNFDGGSYYWQIKINLTTGQLFDFGVNQSI